MAVFNPAWSCASCRSVQNPTRLRHLFFNSSSNVVLLARRGGSLCHFHQTDWHCAWVYKYIYLFASLMPKCRAHLMKSVRIDLKVGSQLEVVNQQRVAIRLQHAHKLWGLIVSLPFQPAEACFPSWSGLHLLIMALSCFYFAMHSSWMAGLMVNMRSHPIWFIWMWQTGTLSPSSFSLQRGHYRMNSKGLGKTLHLAQQLILLLYEKEALELLGYLANDCVNTKWDLRATNRIMDAVIKNTLLCYHIKKKKFNEALQKDFMGLSVFAFIGPLKTFWVSSQ